MHAYHQQLANLSLPNISNLLTTSTQMNTTQQDSSTLSANHYHDLVRTFMAQPSSCNSNNPSSTMASLANRLMSLNPHELSWLNADSVLMRHITETQMLIEQKLQIMHSKSRNGDSRSNKVTQHKQQQQTSPLNHNLLLQNQQHHELYSQQQQQQQHVLLSPGSYLANYAYAQQLAQLRQQPQFYSMSPRHSNATQTSGSGICIDTNTAGNAAQISDLTAAALTLNNQLNRVTNQTLVQQAASAIDLRTTPRPLSAQSATPSPLGSRASSTGSAANTKSTTPIQHPKKLKMAEYKKMQQLAERGGVDQNKALDNLFRDRQLDDTQSSSPCQHAASDNQNRNPTLISEKRPSANKRLHIDDEQSATTALAMTFTGIKQQNNDEDTNNTSGTNTSTTSGKKYKGEFDEPTSDEVSRREQMLIKPGHYHQRALEVGECACVIGSEFQDKTKLEALESLERWRSSDVEERTKWKWDINDLPKEITLPDIKKYEDLRRDFSNGRADFGGASKRRPLGIRGTRQFLLMLYCLWGHPGRDDPMQRQGYCPHCFARIRTENEQSTLVRVVNHFNMKHKKGANPRLSPHSENRNSPKAQPISPQIFQVSDTLISMVESVEAAADSEVKIVRKRNAQACESDQTNDSEEEAIEI